LRRACIPGIGIAISQTAFFTHHGAHPPAAPILDYSELFQERASQLPKPV
jgi:hypothetical protein